MPKLVVSRITETAISTLGSMIKTARKSQSMTQLELAERLGVNVKTIRKIETGHKTVVIAAVFEAAYIVGIPLLSGQINSLQKWQAALEGFNALLPARTHNKKIELDDDF
ncbi:MAG: hypothetical protein A3F17_00750 [Gammaproteobacteria bacterium RIFCSPHIGHO2_12_FULL_41_15]|nr:MAG: hypothetical protein A3F17_00750 [Gammaproteobacteria bacterium RIFCSPHIGHO2_12_FULL_41_15]